MSAAHLRSACRRYLLPCVVVFGQTALDVSALAQDAHKQVLALYANRRDSEFAIIAESELPRSLDISLGRNLDYYSEFIDATRFPEPQYQKAFSDYLRLKYHDVRFDLVVAFNDSAVNFLDEHRAELFAGAPAVFLMNAQPPRPIPNATGFVHERNYTGTLTLLQHLQPDVRNLFIVSGASLTDRQFEQAFRQQLQSSGSTLTFTYLAGLRTSDLEARLSKLPPHSAVYYAIVNEDGDGNNFHPLEYVDRVAQAANAPTYCWVDSAMDHGIVGGSLYSQRAAIERISQLAIRVLRGERADSIPVEDLDLNTNQLDWRQLRRWHIDEARIPAGALVRFRVPTVWEAYRVYILATLAVLLIQTALIVGLLIERRWRRHAEEQLRGSQTELRGSYERIRDLGSRLLRAQETERSRIARELHDDICQRMLLLTMELESLGGSDRDDDRAPTEALTLAQNIAKSLHELSHQLHPTRLRLLGLITALDRLRLEVARATVPIAFTHDPVPPTLSPDVMLCVFRVAQEALQNAIKHSNATELSIHLGVASNVLTLTITDNGTGFDPATAWHSGVGLVSMTERLEALGGTLKIQSSTGAGTRVTATVPMGPVHSGEAVAMPVPVA
jgi:signal transduction histidine kinase